MKKMILNFLFGRGLNAAQEWLSKIVRHGLGTAGGILMGMHFATTGQWDDVTAGAMALLAIIWSFARTKLSKYVTTLLIAPFLVAFLAPSYARADIKTFTWAAPDAYTDNTPLDPATDLAAYVLGCGPTPGDRTTDVREINAVNASGPVTSSVQDFAPGMWFCALLARDQQSRESDWSNEVSFSIAVRPKVPTDLGVN